MIVSIIVKYKVQERQGKCNRTQRQYETNSFYITRIHFIQYNKTRKYNTKNTKQKNTTKKVYITKKNTTQKMQTQNIQHKEIQHKNFFFFRFFI